MRSAQPQNSGKVLTTLMMPLFMALLSVSVINVALPSIENSLHTTRGALQWVLSGYALSFGVVLVSAGRAGDLWGRRKLFVTGLVIFVVGALASVFAPTILILNIARLFTGIGAGMFSPQIMGIIQQLFQGEARGKAYGIFGAVVGLGVSIGPVVGGLIIDSFDEGLGWRLTFLLIVIVGAAAIPLAANWLPEDQPSAERGSLSMLDPLGATFLGLAVVGILLPASSQDPLMWLLAPVAAVALGVWVWWETRLTRLRRHPMVHMGLFKIPSFTIGTANVAFYLGGMTSIWAVVAIFAQQGLGESALVAGLLGLPSAIFVMIASPILGRFAYSHGKPLVVIGTIISLIALGVSTLLAPGIAAGDYSVWWLSLTTAPIGIGQAMVLNISQTLLMSEVPVHLAGAAGGFSQTVQRVFTALGLMFITGLFFVTYNSTGDWGQALKWAFMLTIGFWVINAILSLFDLLARPRIATQSRLPQLDDAEGIGAPPAP